jgi:23S rRNA pseudouridine1911/1915/1917 synthase
MPDRTVQLVVEPEEAGSRLDRFLAARLPDLSRSAVQRLIAQGLVRLSAGTAKPSLSVAAGLEVDLTVPAPAPATPEPENLPLVVLYDDEDIVVVDKAPGVVVHPAAGHARGTLVNALLHHVGGLSGIGGTTRPGIVHRLDRGTSGVMTVAKHDRAHRELARQFREREVTKEYVALVWGRPRAGQAIDLPIGRDPRHRRKMSTRARRARSASTRIVDIEPLAGVSLVRVVIGTGRTHQIRVHLSESGHAIVGDALYGGVRRTLPSRLRGLAALGRPFLHAARLTITHPRTGGQMTFEAPLARDLADVLAALRQAQPARTL